MPPPTPPPPSSNEIKLERQSVADLEWIVSLYEQAHRGRFYGKLTIIMQNGMIEKVVNEQSLKPPRIDSD